MAEKILYLEFVYAIFGSITENRVIMVNFPKILRSVWQISTWHFARFTMSSSLWIKYFHIKYFHFMFKVKKSLSESTGMSLHWTYLIQSALGPFFSIDRCWDQLQGWFENQFTQDFVLYYEIGLERFHCNRSMIWYIIFNLIHPIVN